MDRSGVPSGVKESSMAKGQVKQASNNKPKLTVKEKEKKKKEKQERKGK